MGEREKLLNIKAKLKEQLELEDLRSEVNELAARVHDREFLKNHPILSNAIKNLKTYAKNYKAPDFSKLTKI